MPTIRAISASTEPFYSAAGCSFFLIPSHKRIFHIPFKSTSCAKATESGNKQLCRKFSQNSYSSELIFPSSSWTNASTSNFTLLACLSTEVKTKQHFNTDRFKLILFNIAGMLTLKVLVATIDAQWEGMGDVGLARYEPALLPPCPTIRVLSYRN